MLFTHLLNALITCLPVVHALPAEIEVQRRATASGVPRMVAYIQTFRRVDGRPLSLLPLLTENTGVTHVLLSSVHLNESPGDITLNDDNPNSTIWNTMWDEAAQLQRGGIKVMMMLGGAAQGSYRRLSGDDASFESYYIPLQQTLKAHNIDGLDLDIEEAVNKDCPLRLLRRLHADFGSDFLLSMAPVASELIPNGYGLSGFDYFDMDAAANEASRPKGKLVNWYNAQFYNGWGDARSTDWYKGIVRAGWSSDRVVMGVLDNPRDGGSGYVAFKTLQVVLHELAWMYQSGGFGFGCAVGWEYWDAGLSEGWAEPYEWVRAVAQAVLDPPSIIVESSQDDTPLPDPESPWPNLVAILTALGPNFLESNKALNQTDGDLAGAAKLLDVVLDLTGGILDGVLGGDSGGS